MNPIRLFCLLFTVLALVGAFSGAFYRQDFSLMCTFTGIAVVFVAIAAVSGNTKKG